MKAFALVCDYVIQMDDTISDEDKVDEDEDEGTTTGPYSSVSWLAHGCL